MDSTAIPGNQFVAGDVRANENPSLTSLHTLFVREHNRQATAAAVANPALSDEQLYQQARRGVIALLQKVRARSRPTQNTTLRALASRRSSRARVCACLCTCVLVWVCVCGVCGNVCAWFWLRSRTTSSWWRCWEAEPSRCTLGTSRR